MDHKIYYCLLLIMLVTITVQGARPKGLRPAEQPIEKVFSKRGGECAFILTKAVC